MDERDAYGFPLAVLERGLAHAFASNFNRPAPPTKLQRAQQIAAEVRSRRFPVTKLSSPNL
jgi:hypothetical protein